MRRIFAALVVLAVLVGGLFAGAAVLNMQSPAFIVRYLATAPSEQGKLFAHRSINPSGQPSRLEGEAESLPETVTWKGKELETEKALAETSTNALLVSCHDDLVNEWYRDGEQADRRHSSWSVAKSVVGLVAGQLIDEGRLSEDTLMVEILTEYAIYPEFDKITVGHLLDMASGIDLTEDYSQWKPPVSGIAGMEMSKDIPAYLKKHTKLRFEPGSKAEYRSVDTQYLSMVVTRVEGENLAKVVERRLWQPMGAEDEAWWSLDNENGIEKGYAALNATPRDFNKLGRLIANNGRVGETQVIPEAWIERILTPAYDMDDGWQYSAKWWHPAGNEAANDVTAWGIYGQFVYVNPETGAVVTKLSDHSAEGDVEDQIALLREFSNACN